MRKDDGFEKSKKFISDLRSNKIMVERMTNHGEEFCGAHEKQHRENFQNYLGSCTRYLSNKRMKGLKYHG
jgi:hypothetical protein